MMKSPAQIILDKAILPTRLGSAEIRAGIAADIRRRAIFSARTFEEPYLGLIREVAAKVAGGRMDDATARMRLQQWLDSSGYAPGPGMKGSLLDRSSARRINLILDTQRTMAANVANIQAETDASLDLFPAHELVRFGTRRVPRDDWHLRWKSAGEACGGEGASQGGRMMARKDSPVWQALGDGAGGFTDTLGNPYPPFAFGSSMDWMPVDRRTAEAEGITGTPARPRATLGPGENEIAEALKKFGPSFTADLLKELSE